MRIPSHTRQGLASACPGARGRAAWRGAAWKRRRPSPRSQRNASGRFSCGIRAASLMLMCPQCIRLDLARAACQAFSIQSRNAAGTVRRPRHCRNSCTASPRSLRMCSLCRMHSARVSPCTRGRALHVFSTRILLRRLPFRWCRRQRPWLPGTSAARSMLPGQAHLLHSGPLTRAPMCFAPHTRKKRTATPQRTPAHCALHRLDRVSRCPSSRHCAPLIGSGCSGRATCALRCQSRERERWTRTPRTAGRTWTLFEG
mmetsp:Transcript_12862/g.37767  ORF Transcript_12862/g.37767 Transcript_12862/m.37767 type:complete len:257 (-) Transcript_12862:81-851(-)